jgi:hypothetical protein
MAADLFFLDHNHPEDGSDDDESKSKSNVFEVSVGCQLSSTYFST